MGRAAEGGPSSERCVHRWFGCCHSGSGTACGSLHDGGPRSLTRKLEITRLFLFISVVGKNGSPQNVPILIPPECPHTNP